MVKIEKLKISNFRSFYGEHILEFKSNGLFVLKGRNIDTSGESATGKSSILLAFSYLLNICPYNVKDLTNWESKDDFQLVLYFQWNDKNVVLSRGIFNSIKINNIDITGSKSIEEKIQEIFGLNSEQRYHTLYKEQGVCGYFLNKNNSEKRDFLSSVLNLNEFEKYIDLENKNLILNQKELEKILPIIELIQKDINNIKNKISLNIKPKKIKNLSLSFKDEINNIDQNIKLKNDELKYLKSQDDIFNENKKDKINEQTKLLNKIHENEELLNLDNLINIILNEQNALPTIAIYNSKKELIESQKRNKKNIESEIYKIEKINENFFNNLNILNKNKCYTCNQIWIQKKESENIEKEIINNNNLIQKNKKIIESIIIDSLDDVERLLNQSYKKNEELTQKKNNLILKRNELKEKLSEEIVDNIKNLQKDKSKIYDKINKLSEYLILLNNNKKEKEILLNKEIKYYNKYLIELESYNKLQESFQETLKQKNTELSHFINKKSELVNNINYIQNKIFFTKGFLNYILNDILQEISQETNSLLVTIPNVSNITIEFLPEKVTQKGVIKQEICTLLKINDIERTLKSSLSGGMQTALQLAVDLAVRKIINRRTGKFWGLFLVDEQFGGLDPIGKYACLSLLNEYAKDSLVLVIEHHTELNEAAQNTILIELKNGRSKCIY